MSTRARFALALFTGTLAACASARRSAPVVAPTAVAAVTDAAGPPVDADPLASYVPPRETAPAPSPARDVRLPPIVRAQTSNGIETNVVEYHTLPVLQLRVLVRHAGSAADPADRPGLAAFTAALMKEGTRHRTSAQIAEEIEFVGGALDVSTGPDATVFSCTVLRDDAETALALLAEIIAKPAFAGDELERLRRRELDRLAQVQQDPAWLARRAFLREVYGAHPYAHADATTESLRRFDRGAVSSFHRTHFVTGALSVIAVGDVRPAEFHALVGRTFGDVRRGSVNAPTFPAVAEATGRRVVVVARPDSAQTTVRIGSLAVRRNSDDFVPLMVANHVLGGESSSRLFMELRERRSLTYGAYSVLRAGAEPGTLYATGAVRNEVTSEAVDGFLHEIERIAREEAQPAELADAQGFLRDSFALHVETPADIAGLVTDLRVYNLPDSYWDGYRARIASVTPAQALEAAQRYLRSDRAVIVLVGDRAQIDPVAARLRGDTRAEPARPAPPRPQ